MAFMQKLSGFLAKTRIADMDFYLEENFKLLWESKVVSKPCLETTLWSHLHGLKVVETTGFLGFWDSTQSGYHSSRPKKNSNWSKFKTCK